MMLAMVNALVDFAVQGNRDGTGFGGGFDGEEIHI